LKLRIHRAGGRHDQRSVDIFVIESGFVWGLVGAGEAGLRSRYWLDEKNRWMKVGLLTVLYVVLGAGYGAKY